MSIVQICSLQKRHDYIGNGGLGLSLEGTVDVVDGAELRPHHYIQRILSDSPAARCAKLRAGDELLEVGVRFTHVSSEGANN